MFRAMLKIAGQNYKKEYASLDAQNEEDAKIEFAQMIWDDALSGEFGDNYHDEDEASYAERKDDGQDLSWYEGEGVYFQYDEKVISKEDLTEGLDWFSYDNKTIALFKDDEPVGHF